MRKTNSLRSRRSLRRHVKQPVQKFLTNARSRLRRHVVQKFQMHAYSLVSLVSADVPRMRLCTSLFVVQHSTCDHEVNAECATNEVCAVLCLLWNIQVTIQKLMPNVPRLRLRSSLIVVARLFCRLVCFLFNAELFFLRGSRMRVCARRCGACRGVGAGVTTSVWAYGWCLFFPVHTCLSLTVPTTRGTVPLTLVTARHDRIPSLPYGYFSDVLAVFLTVPCGCGHACRGGGAGVTFVSRAHRVCRATNQCQESVCGTHSYRLFIPPIPVLE